jgi:hypothetical protein
MSNSMITKLQNGSAAVEFAICLLLLIVLVFGIIEFSLILYNKAVITNASREGARTAILFNDPVVGPGRATQSDVESVVTNYCQDYLITFGAPSTPQVDFPEWNSDTGLPRAVRITYRYDFLLLPGFISSLPGGLDLEAVTRMRCE